LRQYRSCVRILEEELGVPPLEVTTELYQALKENQIPEPKPSLPAPSASRSRLDEVPLVAEQPGPAYPFVGRAEELKTLQAVYLGSQTDGRLVSVEGEAGIGKTRLAEEFLAWVSARGGQVLAMRTYAGETNLSYGPITGGLQAYNWSTNLEGELDRFSQVSLQAAARIVPQLEAFLDPDDGFSLEGPGAQTRFLTGLSEFVLNLTTGTQPAVIFLDDAHWADEATLDFFAFMARRLQGHPVCIFMTWRGEGVPPEHPLRRLLDESARANLGARLSLTRLGPAEVAALRQAVMEQPEKRMDEWLYQETEGVPFFVVEYLAIMSGGESLEELGDPLPRGISALLRARLEAVNQTGMQLLSTAAVLGRTFDYETLRAASGRSEEEVVNGLEGLVSQGLLLEQVRGEGGGLPGYDFNHEKLRVLVYDETSLARRRLLHRRAAEALVVNARSLYERGALAGQIAHHYQLAGREAPAAVFYRLAGDHAGTLFDNAAAIEHYRAALALGHPESASVHEDIGDLQILWGAYPAALASYETAAALSPEARVARIEHKLGVIHHRLGDWGLAEGHFKAALGALGEGESAELQANIYVDWSMNAHRQGVTDEAWRLANLALSFAEQAGEPPALAQVHNILGILSRNRGELEEARGHLAHSLEEAVSTGLIGAKIAALNNLSLIEADTGDQETALKYLQEALALCVQLGARHREAALENNLADLLHAMGRSEQAMEHLKNAVTIFAEIGQEAGDWQPEIWKLVEW
jgi:tetratricopeptide (TPR) repeat protein